MLVDPSASLEENYDVLLSVETAIIEPLRPGKKLNEVYAVGLEKLKERKPSLLNNLLKNNFGFVFFPPDSLLKEITRSF